MKIKVCGNKFPENIRAVDALQPDYIGFIFYEKTERKANLNVSDFIETLASVKAEKVGVFVNHNIQALTDICQTLGIKTLQLHGLETPEYCKQLKDGGFRIIKALPVNQASDFSFTNIYKDVADYFLFDTATSNFGGSGIKFNWDWLQSYTLNIPFFLAGGISENAVDSILSIRHPLFYGADVNSRFEISPGLKDIQKVKNFIQQLRNKNTKHAE